MGIKKRRDNNTTKSERERERERETERERERDFFLKRGPVQLGIE